MAQAGTAVLIGVTVTCAVAIAILAVLFFLEVPPFAPVTPTPPGAVQT